MILGNPVLNLRDHIALAATCRSLRSCYYTDAAGKGPDSCHSVLWKGLIALRPSPKSARNGHDDSVSNLVEKVTAVHERAVSQIWTNPERVLAKKMKVLWRPNESGDCRGKTGKISTGRQWNKGSAIRSREWNRAIKLIETEKITKSTALSVYKLNQAQLDRVGCLAVKNPHYKHAAP